MRKSKEHKMKVLVYILIFTSFFGDNLIGVEVGGVQLTLFRALWGAIGILCVANRHSELVVYRGKNAYSVIFMVFWLVWGVSSLLWAIDVGNWARIIFFMMVGIISIIIFNNVFKEKKDIIHAFWAFQSGVVVQAIIGWYEIFTKDYHFANINESFINYYIKRENRIPIAMCGNPNNFATLMFVGVFVSYICIKTSKSKVSKAVQACILISDALLLVKTGSRANIIGLVLATLIILIMWRAHNNKKLIFHCAVVMSLFCGCVCVLMLRNTYNGVLVFGTNSDSIRINLIKNGLLFLIQTFGLGTGVGQIESWMGLKALYDTQGILNMHNWWGEILTAFGITIFIGYLLFYVKMFKDNFIIYKNIKDRELSAISLSMCGILAGYTIASVSASSNMTNESLWIFWAISIAYQGIANQSNFFKSKLCCNI